MPRKRRPRQPDRILALVRDECGKLGMDATACIPHSYVVWCGNKKVALLHYYSGIKTWQVVDSARSSSFVSKVLTECLQFVTVKRTDCTV